MGLIKAALSATGSAFGDQFKEFIECPQIDNNVIVVRGVVKHGEGNKHYTDGVISAGSSIVVPQGMAMMIIDNGKIVEFSNEPGTYTWDSSSESSIFTGGLGKGLIDTFKTIGTRFTYGGQAAKDQRVYYVNTKIIAGNLFGSQQPEVISDPVYGSVEITYNGEYAIRIDDPIILVNNVIGANPKDTLSYDDIFVSDGMNMLKGKFAQKVSEAIATIMINNNVSFNKIQLHKSQITDEMNKILDSEWHEKYGIIVEDVTLRVNASESSRKLVQEMDNEIAKTTRMGQVFTNNPQGAAIARSFDVAQDAANNANGSMAGIMGMNLMGQATSNMIGAAATLPQGEGNEQTSTSDIKYCPNCGKQGNGNFCTQCGTKLNS